jgi:hypothetical protein
MSTSFFIRICSTMSGESLIVSDEFQNRLDAENYQNRLIKLLIKHMDFVNLEMMHTWFNKEFLFEVVEAETVKGIRTTTMNTAWINVWEDFDRVLEFMDHTYPEMQAIETSIY